MRRILWAWISLFDLNGRFYKLLKTQRPVYDVVALTGTKIAYLSYQFEEGGPARRNTGLQSVPRTTRVVLKDIENGNERVVLSRKIPSDFIMMKAGGSFSFGIDLRGGVIIARSADGNLAVGVSNSPNVEIYDLEGKPLRSFALKNQARPATPDYIDRFKKAQIAAIRTDSQMPSAIRNEIIELGQTDLSAMFDRMLPYYSEMLTDTDGNFLFFSWGEEPGRSALDFSVVRNDDSAGRPPSRSLSHR